MSISRIFDSAFSIRLAMSIGRTFPLSLGHRIADLAAFYISKRKDLPLVKAVRANQWIVRGEINDQIALDIAVYKTIQHASHTIFDLYHYLEDPEATSQVIVLDDTARQLLGRPEFDTRGLMLAGIHTSNFDLCLRWLSLQGLKMPVLTIPNPQGGRHVEFEMRKNHGMNLLPASVTATRQALKHLEKGGVVITGIDRPIPKPKACPRFFRHPASLPMHHIFLAVKARVPIRIIAVTLQADRKYHFHISDPIEMDQHPDHDACILQNAEKVLAHAEGLIRIAPEQWSMSLPVWPEVMDKTPS